MISLQDALAIRHRLYAPGGPGAGKITERDTCWLIEPAMPCLGNSGVIVDKEDGHHHVLGSGLPLEEWLFAHEKGFRHSRYSMRILKIHQPYLVLTLLSQMGYRLSEQVLGDLPVGLPFGWMQYPHLPRLAAVDCFDFEFWVTGCDNEDCPALGKRLPALAHPRIP